MKMFIALDIFILRNNEIFELNFLSLLCSITG